MSPLAICGNLRSIGEEMQEREENLISGIIIAYFSGEVVNKP